MNEKKIMVTGAAGSWGQALIELMLEKNAGQICALVRSERQLTALRQQYRDTPTVSVQLCDIRDADRLAVLAKGCHTIFHLAALKHVTYCEEAPHEALQTNIEGTKNVIEAALQNKVQRVVFASTDKAVAPTCTYGCTKLLGEKLILAANQNSCGTRFMVLRSGNLLGSEGSVLALFERQAAAGKLLTLTDARSTRFFISIRQAAEMMLEVAQRGAGGEVFLPKMQSIAIRDIASYMLDKHHRDTGEVLVCGLRPGEKLWEEMTTVAEREAVYRVSEQLYVIAAQDSHGWVSNGFVRATEDYQHCSGDAAVEYSQAASFLCYNTILK